MFDFLKKNKPVIPAEITEAYKRELDRKAEADRQFHSLKGLMSKEIFGLYVDEIIRQRTAAK